MLEVAKKILLEERWFSSQDSCDITELYKGVWEFDFGGSLIFIVCNEEGEENLLNSYREASIDAAEHDIPKIYHDFFEFNDFADYTWQTIYDVYENVDEVINDGKKWYICSL